LSYRRASLGLLVLIACLLAAWTGVLWASHQYTSREQGKDRFLAYWAGTRWLITEGLSPYSAAVADRIQALSGGSGNAGRQVIYPLYGMLLFWPFAAIANYAWARAVWMAVLVAVLFLLAFICLRLSRWHPPSWLLFLYTLLALTWYISLGSLVNGDAVILVALFMLLALEAIRRGRDEFAGGLLVLATIQPLNSLVFIVFVLFWAATQRRWMLWIWFLGFLAFLSAVGLFFKPEWPLEWLRSAVHDTGFPVPYRLEAVFTHWSPGVGKQIGLTITIVAWLILLVEWWLFLRNEGRHWMWTISLTLVLAQWLGIPAGPENFVVLLLPLAVFSAIWEERYGSRGRWMMMLNLLAFGVGVWVWSGRVSESSFRSLLFFLIPLVLLIELYWVRWWAFHPRRLLVDELRTDEMVTTHESVTQHRHAYLHRKR
jgi:hypothetical protein